MLIKIVDGIITNTASISDLQKEAAFLVDNPEYFHTDFAFVEDIDLYEVSGDTFALKADWETIKAGREAAQAVVLKAKQKIVNANAAKSKQDAVLNSLAKNTQKKALGLPPEISDADEVALKEYTKQIQADIDNPPETQAYNPPLPPGVTPPAINSILITITREPGHNDAIGWKAIISSGQENFEPTSLAIAEYSNPNCDSYLYTTGAFQQDVDGTWYAVCPPGQEKGDVDVNLGLLYGAAQLACFTFKAGNQEQKVYAYEEVI